MADQTKKLTTRQKKAIAALITQPDNRSAAKAAGIGERTLYQYLKDDLFLAELHRAEGDIIGAAVRSLIADLPRNIEVMREIRENRSNPAIRLRATRYIDLSLQKWREIQDIEERLTALEQAVINDK
jgi:AcrR family transcriptional regulator